MRRPGIVPDLQLANVVTALYADADAAGWENLATRDRTRMYASWVEASAAGEILAQYMTPEAARSWIKDGPMKEYSRANRGAGRYAEFGRTGGTSVTDIVRVALGDAGELIPGSEQLKPFLCRATKDQVTAVITWGDSRQFKDLLWAALRPATENGIEPHIVVMEPPGRTVAAADRAFQAALAQRCALNVHYMREVLGSRSGRA